MKKEKNPDSEKKTKAKKEETVDENKVEEEKVDEELQGQTEAVTEPKTGTQSTVDLMARMKPVKNRKQTEDVDLVSK